MENQQSFPKGQPPAWLCLWPGLLRLWMHGEVTSLMFAIGFSVLLNLALLSTFVWPVWLGDYFNVIAWSILGLVWVGSWLVSRNTDSEDSREIVVDSPGLDALFIAAQTEYLKGNWHEAEALMVRQLRSSPRDAESRLLLASIHWRSGNLEEAQSQLLELEKLDRAQNWEFEVRQLKQQIEWAENELTETESNDPIPEDSGDDDQETPVTPGVALSDEEPFDQSNHPAELNETDTRMVIRMNGNESPGDPSDSSERRVA